MSDVVLPWPGQPISRWEIFLCWVTVGQMVWSVVYAIPRWWQILLVEGYPKLLCPVPQGEVQRVGVPKGFDLRMQSEGAPKGQMYWSRWLTKKHPSCTVEQSILCSIRVMNFFTECKLWGLCPLKTIHIHRMIKYFHIWYLVSISTRKTSIVETGIPRGTTAISFSGCCLTHVSLCSERRKIRFGIFW